MRNLRPIDDRLATALSLAVIGVFAVALAAVFALLGMLVLGLVPAQAAGVQAVSAATVPADACPRPNVGPRGCSRGPGLG